MHSLETYKVQIDDDRMQKLVALAKQDNITWYEELQKCFDYGFDSYLEYRSANG